MSRYRKIDVRIWGDEKFQALSKPQPNGQSLWFFLLTNKRTTSIPGLYELGEMEAAELLEWSLEGFRESFRELFREGLIKADWKARLVWIPNAIKYDPPQNPNVVKGWGKAWDELPECELKAQAWHRLKSFMEPYAESFKEAFRQWLPEPSWNGMPNPEPEQEPEPKQDQEQEPEPHFPPLHNSEGSTMLDSSNTPWDSDPDFPPEDDDVPF